MGSISGRGRRVGDEREGNEKSEVGWMEGRAEWRGGEKMREKMRGKNQGDTETRSRELNNQVRRTK